MVVYSIYRPNQEIYQVVKVLQENDIPHNMMITFGEAATKKPCDIGESLRVCLWPVNAIDEVLKPQSLSIFTFACVKIYIHFINSTMFIVKIDFVYFSLANSVKTLRLLKRR